MILDITQLYHLSEKLHHNETFKPRSMPKWRAMEGENWRIKRICVAPTIDGALTSLCSSDSQPFGKHFYVHVPDIDIQKFILKEKIYTPTKKQIPDVEATGEMWLKVPVKMKCIGEIEIVSISPEEIFYEDEDGQKIPLDRFIWKWVWQNDKSKNLKRTISKQLAMVQETKKKEKTKNDQARS